MIYYITIYRWFNIITVMYRYDLSKGDAHAVEREMEKLFALGYRWGHVYTQCVLQTLLESIRRG